MALRAPVPATARESVPAEIQDHRITQLHKLPPRGTAWPQPPEAISKVDPADAVGLRAVPMLGRLFHSETPADATSSPCAGFAGDSAIAQLCLFRLAPLVGAVVGTLAYRAVEGDDE